MDGYDLFVYFNFAILIGALSAFAFAYWRDERRRKATTTKPGRTINVTIEADTTEFQTAMARARDAFAEFGRAVGEAAAPMQEIGEIAADVRRQRRRLWWRGFLDSVILGVIVGLGVVAIVVVLAGWWL
jgi:hypothetical protein